MGGWVLGLHSVESFQLAVSAGHIFGEIRVPICVEVNRQRKVSGYMAKPTDTQTVIKAHRCLRTWRLVGVGRTSFLVGLSSSMSLRFEARSEEHKSELQYLL